AWATFRGLELTNSDPSRPQIPNSRPTAVEVFGPHTRLVNLVVHDAGQGIVSWADAQGSEITGCIVYNNGASGADRGIWVQNQSGTKNVVENLVSNNFGEGLSAYAPSTGYLKGLHFEVNVAFLYGSISGGDPAPNISVGGTAAADGIDIVNNYAHARPFHF